MLNRIRLYLYGIVATAFALLLTLVGVQRRTISQQRYEALRRERDAQQARADAATKQAQAKAEAAKEAQARRQQAERDMEQGRKDYFEKQD